MWGLNYSLQKAWRLSHLGLGLFFRSTQLRLLGNANENFVDHQLNGTSLVLTRNSSRMYCSSADTRIISVDVCAPHAATEGAAPRWAVLNKLRCLCSLGSLATQICKKEVISLALTICIKITECTLTFNWSLKDLMDFSGLKCHKFANATTFELTSSLIKMF